MGMFTPANCMWGAFLRGMDTLMGEGWGCGDNHNKTVYSKRKEFAPVLSFFRKGLVF